MGSASGHDAAPSTDLSRTPLASYSIRGALVGFTVASAAYVALAYASWEIERRPAIDGPETLGATLILALEVGIPGSYIAGLLVAWLVRLRRPWLVSLLGLVNSSLMVCGLGNILLSIFPRIYEIIPRWVTNGGLAVVAYAATAGLMAYFMARHGEASGRRAPST